MSGFGLLGGCLSHSYSPLIHAELGNYEYKLFKKRPDEVEDFLRRGNFKGINVTIPYKKTVIPFCTGLSEAAKVIGSVNTITRLADGSLYGDNTDYFGFSYLLKKSGAELNGGKVLILGSGGSSLTAQAVLHDLSNMDIVVVSRNGADNYENIGKHSDAVMIVNTTPVGMYPENGVSPIKDLSIFRSCKTVIDMIYNPLRTELLLQAEERGISCTGGLAMLAAQAKRAAELFTGLSIPDDKIESITLKITGLTRNIILIGMPGCGKSTIGAILAEKTGREFADTDEWVEKRAGKSIPMIFAEDGEEAFRKLENEALEELCKQSGYVIATGGGIVKNEKNWNIIRQNGIVVFINRDLADLPVSGRPLSEKEGITALAEARLPVYTRWSDFKVKAVNAEETAEEIRKTVTEEA